MKYGGTITIVDDGGVVVFERELSSDEMITELIPLINRTVPAKQEGTPPRPTPKKGGNPGGVDYDRKAIIVDLHAGILKVRDIAEKNGVTPAIVKNVRFDWHHGKYPQWDPPPGLRKMPNRSHPTRESSIPREVAPAKKIDHGRLLTKEEWETARDMKDRYKNTMQIQNALGADCSFQQINWAILLDTYDGYIAHATAAK